MRATAWGVVAAGVLAPLVRKRVKAPPLAMQAAAFAAPVGLAVAVRRSRARDVAVCSLQMWAYLAAYKTPHDDERGQERRVRIDYPIAIDRVLGLGELPTVRLQRALARVGPDGPRWRTLDRVLVWAHWSWFMVPHGGLLYILLRHPRRFDRAAVLTYAVFDIGAMIYWVLPTAPPWYAAAAPEGGGPGNGGSAHDTSAGGGGEANAIASPPRVGARVAYARGGVPGDEPAQRRTLAVRRMMVEYGEDFWEDSWGPLYSVLGGNPLAAMPSLHFATSVMAAQLLAETGPVAGALGWSYACTLGFALVYLGEHYAVDLLAGAALSAAVGRLGPRARPLLVRCAEAVAALEAGAHGAS
ncbi:MAG TPA: phosphatase PAP2 family protein [Solirubrobacteraceae bacterium]|jgi:membrane-associated phospholipid phosphatase